jgi:hypothetical protein
MGSPRHAFVELLLNNARRLPEYRAPRAYWATRHGRASEPPAAEPDPQRLRRERSEVVADLRERGYLDKVASSPCVDDRGDPPDPDDLLAREVEDRSASAACDRLGPADRATEAPRRPQH